jgi:hypothetical protein
MEKHRRSKKKGWFLRGLSHGPNVTSILMSVGVFPKSKYQKRIFKKEAVYISR